MPYAPNLGQQEREGENDAGILELDVVSQVDAVLHSGWPADFWMIMLDIPVVFTGIALMSIDQPVCSVYT
jgi:hypothetical protein